MRSDLIWFCDDQIALIESQGRWNPTNLLSFAHLILKKIPLVIIWDPTHVIMDTEMLATRIEETSESRQNVFQVVVKILQHNDYARFILVRNSKSPIFAAFAEIYQQYGMESQLVFVTSQAEAMAKSIEIIDIANRR